LFPGATPTASHSRPGTANETGASGSIADFEASTSTSASSYGQGIPASSSNASLNSANGDPYQQGYSRRPSQSASTAGAFMPSIVPARPAPAPPTAGMSYGHAPMSEEHAQQQQQPPAQSGSNSNINNPLLRGYPGAMRSSYVAGSRPPFHSSSSMGPAGPAPNAPGALAGRSHLYNAPPPLISSNSSPSALPTIGPGGLPTSPSRLRTQTVPNYLPSAPLTQVGTSLGGGPWEMLEISGGGAL